MAVDHPFIAIFVRKSFNQRWITARHFRFGHGKARTLGTFTKRTEILLFLFGCRPVQQRVLVPLIRCLSVQHVRPNAHLCGFSRNCSHCGWTKAHSAPLCRHVRKPQIPFFTGQFPQFHNGLHYLRAIILIYRIPLRTNLFVHEGANF